MTRREAREQAFILVFEQEVREESIDHILHDAVEARDLVPSPFAEQEALGVEEHREEIDGTIEKHIRGWSIRRLSKVALALCGLRFMKCCGKNLFPTACLSTKRWNWPKHMVGKMTLPMSMECWHR